MTVGVVRPIGEEATRFVTWVTRPAKEAQPVVDAISLGDGGEFVVEHGTFAISSALEPVQDKPMGARSLVHPASVDSHPSAAAVRKERVVEDGHIPVALGVAG